MSAKFNKIINKARKLFVLRHFYKPDFRWLYKNRFLRMDANEGLYDVARRDFHKDRYKFVVSHVGNGFGKTVLDAACGTGYGSDILKKLNPEQIVGVDSSPGAVKYARKKYGNKDCRFIVSDVMNIKELDDNSIDIVVSFETIEHLDDPLRFLKEIKRVLKAEGYLFISTPNKWGPTKDHQYDYDYDLLREHLEQFFATEKIYVQNSGCQDLWINRGAPRRIVEVTPENIEHAECFVAVCRHK